MTLHPRLLRAILSLLVLVLLLLPELSALSAPLAQDDDVTIYKVYLTDQRDGSFVVSWGTDVAADGRVEWGAVTPPANTALDPALSATMHRVVVPEAGSLQAGTEYAVQVQSGAVIEDCGGEYYRQTTGPTLSLPGTGNTIWGYVYHADGTTPAADAVVYVRARDEDTEEGDSQWVTARTDGAGVWYYVLKNLRTADASGYFLVDPGIDRIHLIARANSAAAQEMNLLVPADFPGGAAQLAAVTLADPPDATSAQVTIELVDGSDAYLTWPYAASNADYEVWASSEPYADPRAPETHRIGELERGSAEGLAFTQDNAAGEGNPHFYTILAYDLAGKPGALSNRTGVFSFSLTKGTN